MRVVWMAQLVMQLFRRMQQGIDGGYQQFRIGQPLGHRSIQTVASRVDLSTIYVSRLVASAGIRL